MTNDYYFVSRWQPPGPIEDVYDVLADPMEYPRWWPEVYLAVEKMAPGDANGLGRRLRLHTKGRLPYTIRWGVGGDTEMERPRRLAIRAEE